MGQQQKPEAQPQKVAARNSFSKSNLYRRSKALELQGQDPDYVYEYFSTDPAHPSFVGKRLQVHETGNAVGGFAQVAAWQVVERAAGDRISVTEFREDQGKTVDTKVRHGNQILCKLPREEHAKYAVAQEAYQDALERQIYSPERQGDRAASMTAVVSKDENANQLEMLRASGHLIPGN